MTAPENEIASFRFVNILYDGRKKLFEIQPAVASLNLLL
jgi:hypothetical protein